MQYNSEYLIQYIMYSIIHIYLQFIYLVERVNDDCTVDCENVLQNTKRDVCLHKLEYYVNIIAQLDMVVYYDS